VYAQPLVVANSDGSMNVYVATMQDDVYVFSVPATANWTTQTCTQLQSTAPVSLLRGGLAGQYPADACFIGKGFSGSDCSTRAICPSVGVLGTPVIDSTSNTMYLVTESQDTYTGQQGVNCTKTPPKTWYHYLHALDLTSSTLAEKNGGPVQITPPQPGQATFQSEQLLQRPGLLFLPPRPPFTPTEATVYAAFSMMDGTFPNPSGWVLAYDGASLTQGGYPLVFVTTPGVAKGSPAGGGVWQGGAGLAAGLDANQNTYVYLSTADGVFDANNSGNDYGDSFLKLNTELQLAGYFTPSDYVDRWNRDLDFGSAGEMLVPDNTLPQPYDHMVIKGDKEKYIWAIDRTNPSTVLQQLSITNADARSTPAFWFDGTKPFIYIAQQYTQLTQYKLATTCTPPNPPPLCPTGAVTNADPPDLVGYAATPSVSSNGNQNNGTGIVWALPSKAQNSPLYAFDAESLNVLYKSMSCPNDHVGPPTPFSVPTVANGYVFMGTQTDFDIFGLNPGPCN
jgi:hypothetical protein